MKKFFTQASLLLTFVGAVNFAAFAQTEKAIETTAKVNVSFCIASGDVKVRGWQRNEVRVWSETGRAVFKVKERDQQNKPVWLFVTNVSTNPKNYDECLRGEEIVIEVPYTASVGLKSLNSNHGYITIDSVAKAAVNSIESDVELRNVTQEMDISSLSGNIAVEDSSGKIRVKTFGGDIAAFRLHPNDFSDTLKVGSTSGSIIVRDVTHKNIEAVSTNGELSIYNSLVRGGSYDFNTTNGVVTLQLPADFPFQFRATINAEGNFQNDFPLKFNTTSVPGQSRLITGSNGTGDTSINLTTFNCLLRLKKK
jgi:formylmethanofuran dehydrogenase subunit D